MPKPPTSKKNRTDAAPEESGDAPLSFEEAIDELQEIVNHLEDSSLGLEASLTQFERGIGLLRDCHSFLEQAEKKIEILISFKANGEPTTAPFDASPTAGTTEPKSLF